MAFGKKKKKEIQPWRQNILAHHNHTPTRADRAEFPRKVIEELIEEAGGVCQCGCGRPDQETHHVMPRGRDGRGVKTNGMRVNSICHHRIQTSEEELQHWILIYRTRHGNYFWYDEQDWEEHNRRRAEQKRAEIEERLKMERVEPILKLMSTAAGRGIKAKERRLIEMLSEKDARTFNDYMRDVVTASAPQEKPFGYGFFDD
ncbi:HNH endonuclease [Paenibacillus thiaminolyticus]|uniref:HNH endonuclease n=1 Tax=Paenibacillus thiaminolyticus TaxID=49283 RepID=UPI0013F660DB|nr:HNH endonuclease [Paenibacillus thiaminolyticus]NGP58798.1 HNH endonuclease [Paenibacillus thiaminolyticus]